jgi:hypothetical protein
MHTSFVSVDRFQLLLFLISFCMLFSFRVPLVAELRLLLLFVDAVANQYVAPDVVDVACSAFCFTCSSFCFDGVAQLLHFLISFCIDLTSLEVLDVKWYDVT